MNFICTLKYINYKDQLGNLFWKKMCRCTNTKTPALLSSEKIKTGLNNSDTILFHRGFHKVYSYRQCSSTGDAMQLNLQGLNTVLSEKCYCSSSGF